jgi:hypothetical protein
MKSFYFILFLIFGAFLVGCDDRTTIPPTCVGTGTVMLFREKNDDGKEVFEQSLNDFLAAHPEMKVVSQRSLESSASTAGLKMVIFSLAPGAQPPAVNDPLAVEAK